MQPEEVQPIDSPETLLPELTLGPTPAPRAVAPAWHTIVLVVAILISSIHGAVHYSVDHGPINRLAAYGLAAGKELALLAWVVLGLRLSRTSFRSLLGSFRWNLRSVALDLAFAFGFWIASLMVLGSLGVGWLRVEAAVTHRPAVAHVAGQPLVPDPSQRKTLHTLTLLAPADREEIAAWALLCILVGFIEEVVFRGYLQRQFIAWARGGVMTGVLFSALLFGGAHGYEGARSMFLLAVFGGLFSVLAIIRRSLRAGIFAHAWHDLFVGLTLALLKSYHLI